MNSSKYGPLIGSDEYKEQVRTIYTQFIESGFPIEMLGRHLLMFVFDETYSRSAICMAERLIREEMKKREE